MGCDIYCHFEVKIKDKWEHYSEPNIGRNYALFGLMAGVRNYDIEPIIQPKGLPDNLSIITQMCWDRGDEYHHPSWFNSEEVKILDKKLDELFHNSKSIYYTGDHKIRFGYVFNQSLDNLKHFVVKGVEDVRLIFWFAN